MQVIGASHAEIGTFAFWDFKIPKTFRSNLFARYPLTFQDRNYSILGCLLNTNKLVSLQRQPVTRMLFQ